MAIGGMAFGGMAFGGIALAMVVIAGGCGSSSPASAPTTVSTTAPAPATTATSPSSAAATTAVPTTAVSPPTPTTTPGPSRCSARRLTGTLSKPNGTAGAVDYALELLNTGSVPCILQGYPGVSFVAGSNGHQVGAAAVRLVGSTPVVVVAPGHAAQARVSVTDAHNFPTACHVTSVLGLRIYPPDNTTSIFLPHTDQTCAARAYKILGIGPLQAP